ncbi:histone-fold-containing protein [Phlegmacium glaucopus]|nr:histone-fold-containing protein [Phlegmacium glaucopus]
MPRKDAYTGPISAQAQQDLVSEGIENYELPKSVVMKIAKSSIPDNVKLQKETVLSLVKGSTVFINYLAATAHDVALSKQHKSISASDVLKALEMLEFTDMVEQLQGELQVYRQLAKPGDKKVEKKKSSHLTTATTTTTTTTTGAASSSRKTIPPSPPRPILQESAPPPPPQQADHVPVIYDVPMDVDDTAMDEQQGSKHVEDPEVREDEEVGVEDEEEEVEEPFDSDAAESDELEDKVALEEEELQKDHQGLDGPPSAMVIVQED